MKRVLIIITCLTGCTGTLDGDDAPTDDASIGGDAALDGATTGDTTPPPGDGAPGDTATGGDTSAPPTDGGKPDEGTLDVGPCTTGLSTVDVATPKGTSGPVYAMAAPTGHTVIAWADGDGVKVRRVDALGATSGLDATIAGTGVHGLAVSGDAVAVLVERAPDVLSFVRVDLTGKPLADVQLTGKSDHAVVGSEWYAYSSTFAADGGRLAWTGSDYVAYFPIFRHWPDGISHTGDTLRTLGLDGVAQGGGWSWGCSHSLDVRLAPGGTPVCLSDCYSQKAILFSNSTVISAEPSGNCAGSSNAALGGLVEVSDGFWLTYVSPEGRSSRDVALVKLDKSGAPGTPSWLTSDPGDDSAAHLVAFGSGLLAGYRSAGSSWLVQLDATGKTIGAPLSITASFRDKDDFFAWPGGDVGWVYPEGSTIHVHRYRACK
ncbi:MAG: hypothetical protein ABI175_11035 [Polyangiales bacterium]